MDLFTLVGKIAVDASEATNNIQIVIDKVNELNLALNGAESGAQEAGKATGESFGEAAEEATKETGSTMSKWNVFLGNMATQAANSALRMGKSFFQTGFEFNQNMEKWTASFKTYMGGDLEAASAFMEEVRQFAIETPLSLSDSVQSAVRVMASGIDKSEVIDTLRMLGDIANGDTEKMSRLALVYSQVMAAGTLKGNDPNQFKEAGVPIYDLLLDYYHANGYDYIDKAFLQEMQRKGGITSEEVLGALQMATSEGGMYYNAMNNIMGTEYGQAQKMLDNYEQAAGSFTKAIFDVFASDTIPALNDILQQLNEWATENPDALKKLGEAFSALATGGVDVLLTSLTSLLTFWNENQDMFNAMLVLFGGIAIKSGHIGAGMALITAGGYNVWDDWLKEQQGEFSALTSDVDLPFIRQQLEYQGKADQWEAYLDGWKEARRGEGYSDEDINAFIEKQFEGYTPLTAEQLAKFVPAGDKGSKNGLMEWIASLSGSGSYDEGTTGQYNDPNFFVYTPAEDDAKSFFNWEDYADGLGGNSGGSSGGIQGLIGAVQALVASNQSMKGDVASAIAEGLGGITITGTVTTGNVTLDTGAVIGEFAPRFDLYLGQQDRG